MDTLVQCTLYFNFNSIVESSDLAVETEGTAHNHQRSLCAGDVGGEGFGRSLAAEEASELPESGGSDERVGGLLSDVVPVALGESSAGEPTEGRSEQDQEFRDHWGADWWETD